jgi:hypothetical protein
MGSLPRRKSRQSFYFPTNHPKHAGLFKGMSVILQERGLSVSVLSAKRAQCRKNSKCEKGPDWKYTDYCLRRIIFEQTDFVNLPFLLESLASDLGVVVVFLPRFHPELNFIEQCWGFAKRPYRETPPSSALEDLEWNTCESLDRVPTISMRK